MTQRAISFEADLDISDVTRGLNRIEQHARRAGGAVGRVGGGLGRGAGGVGRTVGAGAGIGAGAAAFELIFQKIFELFEGTPVLETFVMALDTLFKAFGPVIGVLLDSLTPVLIALTPAIEPLARALIPLIELFGAGLLIAVQLLVPAIVLFAEGLEKVTTFIKNTVLIAFQFIVDQLNKLPFVDIQVDLANTGDSFDAMAGQIETAGTMAGTATTAVAGFATATDAEKEAADKAKIATDLWAQAARENEAAAKPLTTVLGILSDEMDETYTATDNLGIIIGKTVPQVSALTTQYVAENAALILLNPKMDVLTGEMDEMYTASDNLGVIIGASKGPANDLANAIDQMTMDIENAQAAADLNKAAFAGLTPELMAAAAALGLFRQEVAGVGAATGGGSGPGGDGSGDTPPLGSGGNAGSGDGSSKGGLDADEVERGLRNKPVGSWIRDRYSGGYWIKTREPRGNNDRTGTGYPRWARHVRTLPMPDPAPAPAPDPGGGIAGGSTGGGPAAGNRRGGITGGGSAATIVNVNVQVGDETVDAITEVANHRRDLTGR